MDVAHAAIVRAASKRDPAALRAVFDANTSLDRAELRAIAEQEERLALTKLIKDGASVNQLTKFVDFAISNADSELVTKNAPIVLLSDILDTSTIDQCEKVFEYVEGKAAMWTSPFYFESCRNHLLRMCNDLLRRLSRSTDTLFCGRILIFLARCLPLMEKSGLNLMSNFNAENVTTFDETEEEHESCLPSPVNKETGEEMEEGEMAEADADLVDFGLYTKFWQMQSYFSQPTTCFSSWRKFRKQSDEVLSVLTSWKLEDSSGPAPLKRRRDSIATEDETYFAKYLTSQKLLQLQLNDGNFRRCVLVQFLIVFQYLLADVKFKEKRVPALTEEQSTWIAASTSKIYRLLAETHPHGQHFSDSVKNILIRENNWNEWKNAGCPEYPKLVDSTKMPKFSRRRKIQNFAADKADMGNPVLTRLWKQPDNFEVSKSKDRQFVPDLASFIDREGYQIPEDPKETPRASEQNYQWRCLRLLAQQSNHFFTSCSQNANPVVIPNFLRDTIKTTFEGKEELREPLSNAASAKEEADGNDSDSDVDDDLVTNEMLDILAGLFGADFETLQTYMTKLAMLGDEYTPVEVATDNSANETSALALLKAWKQKYGTGATVQMLQNTLQAAEVFNEDIATVLQGIPAPDTEGRDAEKD